ncbi:MAG: hypothetical protein U9R06_03650, partial [Patescibacteria group bacterium]|nr:hypothetical protein [Patescibacteria group bacterium]
MPKNILIINFSKKLDSCLIDLFENINTRGYKLRFLIKHKNFEQILKEKSWPYSKTHCPIGENNNITFFFFPLFLLLGLIVFAPKLIFKKLKHKIGTIICFGWQEKIIFTPIAKLLKIKIIWLEIPGLENFALYKPLNWLYRFNARLIKIIIFSSLILLKLLKII